MRQKEDETFIDVLDNIRVGECSEDNVKQIPLRKIDLNSVPLYATVIFAKNKPKDEYNTWKLNQLNHFEIKVEAIDFFSDTIPIHLQILLSSRSCSATAGFPLFLKLKKVARVLFTSNVDLSDRLINGFYPRHVSSSVTKVCLKLDDDRSI